MPMQGRSQGNMPWPSSHHDAAYDQWMTATDSTWASYDDRSLAVAACCDDAENCTCSYQHASADFFGAPMAYLGVPHYAGSHTGSTETTTKTEASGDEQDHYASHDDGSPTPPPGSKSPSLALSAQLSSTKSDRKRAHTAVERKYRGNLIHNFDSLRKALNTAHVSHTRTMTLATLAKRQGNPALAKTTEVGSKKAEILSSAISYVQQAEQSTAMLLHENAMLRAQLDQMERSARCEDLNLLKQISDARCAAAAAASSKPDLMHLALPIQHPGPQLLAPGAAMHASWTPHPAQPQQQPQWAVYNQ